MPGCYMRLIDNWDQRGYQASGTYYGLGDSANSFDVAVGTAAVIRFPQQIPKGATITSATLRVDWAVKDSNASGQTMTHVVKAEATGNSAPLVSGAAARTNLTTASTTWVANFPVGGSIQQSTIDVTAIVQELVNRSDWQPGGYITFVFTCTAENGTLYFHYGNGWTTSPLICNITYTEDPAQKMRWDVNELTNSNFGLDPQRTGSTAPLTTWHNNPMWGAVTDAAGEIVWDTAMQRRTSPNYAQVGTIRFTTPAPQDTRHAGFINVVNNHDSASMVFAGWLYVPSYITSEVNAQFAFNDGGKYVITARDRWVPFCTAPVAGTNVGGEEQWLPHIRITHPFQQGWQVWLSDPVVMRSKVRQMPWHAESRNRPDITHGVGSTGFFTYGMGQQVRTSRCRTYIPISGTPRPRPSYVKDEESGLLVRVEKQKVA